MTSPHLRRCCSVSASALAVLAAAAPAASARPALDSPGHAGIRSAAAPAQTVVESTDGGFEWASGAIGAGGAVVLFLTAGGALTLSRRHKELAS
jgi:hypothetical protein